MPDQDLHLPERLDGTTVSHLSQELLTHRGQPCELHADRVKSIGTLGLQLLISAKNQWAADSVDFNIIGGADVLDKACKSLGISPSEIGVVNEEQVPS